MFRAGDEIPGIGCAYRVEGAQGAGTFGATYRAVESTTGRRVIVKAIALRGMSEWKMLELFEREAAALRRIDHPRVPRYESSFILDGGRVVTRPDDVQGQPTFMLVQEFIAGESLASRLRARGPLPAPMVPRLFNALLDIVEYLHELQPPIIHRDIKPSNVVLDETDEPHLVDFGAVRECLRRDGSVGSTVAGTFGYMPGEQAMGGARPASDLYALAMTVVVAATGKEPGDLPMDDRKGKVRLSGLGLPAAIVPALDGMLEPIVGSRLTSVAAVRKVLAGGPRRTRMAALAVSAALAGVLGGFTWVAEPHDAGTADGVPVVQPGSSSWFSRVRPHCNAIEAEITLKRDPAPATATGQALTAACYALAGRIALAKKTLDDLPAQRQARAANLVFDIVHPVADQGDDEATGPIMRLVLDYTPDNYMALYHAGVAEYQGADTSTAAVHLRRFLELYKVNDGWGASARRILGEIERPSGKPCEVPLVVDPEGRVVRSAGCR